MITAPGQAAPGRVLGGTPLSLGGEKWQLERVKHLPKSW